MRIRSALAFTVAFLLSASMAVTGAAAQAAPKPAKPIPPAPVHKWVVDKPAAAAAATGGALTYHGGAYVVGPRVYVVYWGDWSGSSPGSDPNNERQYLNNFLSVVGDTPWLDTLVQYNHSDGNPASLLAGQWNDTSTVQATGSIPNQAQVEAEVDKAAAHFGFATSPVSVTNEVPSNIILVATPGAYIDTSVCGYHNTVISSVQKPYTVPYIYEPYAQSACSAGAVFPNTQVPDDVNGDNDGISLGVGHELAETVTDPVPGTGWTGPGGEIGDECQATSSNPYTSADQAIMGSADAIGTDHFAVQPLWDNGANACVLNYDHWFPWSGTLGAPSAGLFGGSTPAVSSWGPSRLDVFTVDNNGDMQHKWFNGSNWSANWENRGQPSEGQLLGSVAAVSWGANRIDVFGFDNVGNIVHQWWDGTSWSGWKDEIGHPSGLTVGPPTVSSWGPGRLDVFTRGSDGAVWHDWYDGGSWHSWQSLGGNVTAAPGAVSWGPNRIDLFALGTGNNQVWHKWWNGTAWINWVNEIGAPSGGGGSNPGASSWGSGRLDVFEVDSTNDHVWHAWYDGGWHYWQDLAGVVGGGASAASWLPNRVDVFGVGRDNGVVYWLRYG